MNDIRWLQRFDNYKKAFKQLKDALELSMTRDLSLLEKQGVIQSFEFTHELAWNLIKDYLEYQGYTNIKGSRDVFREAFKIGIIKDGELWMQTIKARNITSHVYDESMVNDVYNVIIKDYCPLFKELLEIFTELK